MPDELKKVTQIAAGAGKILLKYYGQHLDIQYKTDRFDPVTLADTEADAYLRAALAEAYPGDQILSEENESRPINYSGRVWMVDPLDGTKDFIGGRDSFSIIIGLYQDNRPELGVVYVPTTGELLYARRGQGAFRNRKGVVKRLAVSKNTSLADANLVTRNYVEGDIRPLDRQLEGLKVKNRIPEGSIGLKIGRIADGTADAFVHSNLKACKWDTLGSQVILTEAGGIIADLEGKPLDYEKPAVGWDKYFVATNNQKMLEQVLDEIKIPA